jgi:diguanylate cyclase (GGDEF)-like protein
MGQGTEQGCGQATAGIASESLIECFPISFMLDAGGRLIRLGGYFARHHPELAGKRFSEAFALDDGCREAALRIAGLAAGEPDATLPRRRLEMRLAGPDGMPVAGTFLPLAGHASGALFIGTIAPREIAKVTDYGLTMSDFGPFDAATDFAMMAQVNEAVVKDTRMLNERLAAARDEAVRARKSMEAIALVDTLSGLANRAAFQQTLNDGAAEIASGRPGAMCSLLLIDIDNFKPINDRYGHAAGDELIKSIGQRIRGVIGTSAQAFRIGGDEFAVIVPGTSAYEARRSAANIMRSVHEPHYVNDRRIRVSASCGLACRMSGLDDLDSLYKAADIALYEAKRSSIDKLQTFDAEMGQRELEKKLLERDLVEAIEKGQLEVFIQPQFDILTGAITGGEGLARWWNGRLASNIPPSLFVAMAEDCGLVAQIDLFVFETVLREQRALGAGARPVTWSTNLSPLTLGQEDLPQKLRGIMSRVGRPVAPMAVEITEGAIVNDAAAFHDTLQAISRMGMEVAIDDFGAGQTSLSHLTRMPISRLKLDRSLVERIDNDDRAATIARAIVALAHELGLSVTAEGIERVSQADRLRRMGPMKAQGFLYARPMPIAEFAALIGESKEGGSSGCAAAG